MGRPAFCQWLRRRRSSATATSWGVVGPSFKMRVPAYVDYDGHLAKLGTVPVHGSGARNELKVTLGRRPLRVLLNAYDDILATQK